MRGQSALVGRTAELARLRRSAGDPAAASGRLVLVVGEAGIGKTRLVDELVATKPAGTTVARGRADELDPAAFGLWMPVLAQLALPRPGPDASASGDERRWEVVDLLAGALQGPMLVVLEDLHWATDEDLWVLEQVLDRCSGRAVAVVATTRPGPSDGASRWQTLYRRAEVVGLDGLDVEAVATLAAQLGSSEPDPVGLRERTGGNPLFVRELLTSRDAVVSSSIDALLTAAIEQLGPKTAGVVSLVAAAGPGTPRSVLSTAAGSTRHDLDSRIDEAARADILRIDGDTIRFRHDLLAEAAARRLDTEERIRAHLALAEAHTEVGGPAAEHAAARHMLSAVPAADPTEAAEAALAAAGRLHAGGRVSEAAALLQLASASISDGALRVDPAVRAKVAVAEAEARWALDEYGPAVAAGRRAVDLAEAAGDPVVAAAAQVVATAHANPFIPDPDAIEKLSVLDDLLNDDDSVDPALRIRLRGRRAVLTMAVPDRIEDAVALGDDAVARARRLGDPDVLVTTLADRLFSLRSPADFVARGEAAAEIVRVARSSRRPHLARLGHEWTYATRMYDGDLKGAIAALEQLEILAAIMPSPKWRYGVAIRRGCVLAMLGDYEGTLDVAAGSQALASGVVDTLEADGLELMLRVPTGLLYGRDDHGCEGALARSVEGVGDLPVLFLQTAVASGEALVGDVDSARRRVAPWLGRLDAALDGAEGLVLLGMLAHLADVLGWPEIAVELRPLLTPFAGKLPTGDGALGLSVDHHLGALALLEGDDAAGLLHARDAVAFARQMRSPVLEAHALALLAAANERTGDTAAAASARDAAATIADPLGMRLPEPGSARSAARRPTTGTPSTSARSVVLRRAEGRWSVRSPFGCCQVADSVGMKQLVQLVTSPGVEISSVDLAGVAVGQPFAVSSDLGPALDARAKREYRQRIGELQADIAEAEAHNDDERAAKHRLELDALLDQLRAAVGIGGRDRPQGSGSERARVNAARTVRRAIAAVAREVPELGAHLEVSIRTGHRCSYSPEPAAALAWTVERA